MRLEWDVGPGGGPLLMMKDSLFLLISNFRKVDVGPGRGLNNDDERFSCFH